MGYSIYIGEAEICYSKNMDESVFIRAKEVENENAPLFGFMHISGKSNSTHPSYSGMSSFSKSTGLYSLFFEKGSGLLSFHPDCRALNKKHLDEVKTARLEWEKKHPDCKKKLPLKSKEPSDFKDLSIDKQLEISAVFDWCYAKLLWYEFWFEWALKNCERPVIVNL